MSILFNCQSISKSYGPRTLFKNLDFSIFEKDRIGLIGPNGSGKSTFLKIIKGLETQDSGILSPKKGLKIGYVPQTCEFEAKSVKNILLDSIDSQIADYEKEHKALMWLSKMGFVDENSRADLLSGGWKKRLRIAQELINEPQLLLLDEPTNHLDLEGVIWLEKFLQRQAPTYLLISHDRYFLEHVTNRIVEINPIYPEAIVDIDGSYSRFLSWKESFLEGQISQEKGLKSKAKRESDWLKQGAKARTTKAQSRIDDAHLILQEHQDLQVRNRKIRADISFSATERQTRKLLTLKNVSKSLGNKVLFKNLDFVLSPGTRLGLMGPNGSGKTTLLKIIAGELSLDVGTIKRADDLKVVYFDQHRNKLPDHITLKEALSPKGDYVVFNGQNIHVNGWCKRFLFSPDLLDMNIGRLSGGERARISLAHLMLEPADLLLLDEPTNDLDIETLETFEKSLMEFQGAVVLITHDRCMLDRVCNHILALGDTEVPTVFPDYHQWQASQKAPPILEEKKAEKVQEKPKQKLSYMEKKEYEESEAKINQLEEKLNALNIEIAKPHIALDSKKLNTLCLEISLLENQIEKAYLRFEELDKKARG